MFEDDVKGDEEIMAYWTKRNDKQVSHIRELEADLKLNASMLSKQCDLAREAETRVKELENLKIGYQDELGWINKKLEQAEADSKRLREAIEYVVNGDIELLDPEIYETLKTALEQNIGT